MSRITKINKNKVRIKSGMLVMLLIILVLSINYAATHGNIEISIPAGEGVELIYNGSIGNTHYYSVKSTSSSTQPIETDLRVFYEHNIIDHVNEGIEGVRLKYNSYKLKLYSDKDHVYINANEVNCTSSTPYIFEGTILDGQSQLISLETNNDGELSYKTTMNLIPPLTTSIELPAENDENPNVPLTNLLGYRFQEDGIIKINNGIYMAGIASGTELLKLTLNEDYHSVTDMDYILNLPITAKYVEIPLNNISCIEDLVETFGETIAELIANKNDVMYIELLRNEEDRDNYNGGLGIIVYYK